LQSKSAEIWAPTAAMHRISQKIKVGSDEHKSTLDKIIEIIEVFEKDIMSRLIYMIC